MFNHTMGHISTSVLLLIILYFSSDTSAQVTAERILPTAIYFPGWAMAVQIKIAGEPGSLHVTEIPPAGWAVKSVALGGILDQGIITWDKDSLSGTMTFRYQVTPPADASGIAVFSGSVNGQDISGMKELQACQVDPSKEYRLPPVTGPHRVGTEIHHWIDTSRDETHTPKDPNDKRELMVQIWYPTDEPGDTPPIACFPDFEYLKSYYAAHWPLPELFFTLICRITANAVPNAPLSNANPEYPVLLYSPGDSANRNIQNYLMEDLASHGYVVIGMDHTYNVVAMRFPDGRIVERSGGSVDLHTKDALFVLEQAIRLNQGTIPSRFTGRLDERRIGIMGMSLGGGVMESAMKADRRIMAGINYDGGSSPSGIPHAVMYFGQSIPSTTTKIPGGGYGCKVANTLHMDFAEGPMWWHVLGLPGKFPWDSKTENPMRMCRIINDYSIAFFDKILKGKTVPLLDGSSPDYPEVTFVSYGEPKVMGVEEWYLY